MRSRPRGEAVFGAALGVIRAGARGAGADVVEFDHPGEFEQTELAVAVAVAGVVAGERNGGGRQPRGIDGKAILRRRGRDRIAARPAAAVARVLQFDHAGELKQAELKVAVRIRRVRRDRRHHQRIRRHQEVRRPGTHPKHGQGSHAAVSRLTYGHIQRGCKRNVSDNLSTGYPEESGGDRVSA